MLSWGIYSYSDEGADMCNAMHAVNSIGRPQIRFRRIFSLCVMGILSFFFLAFIPSANAQIEWTPEAQVNWNDLYNDWAPKIAVGNDGKVWAAWESLGPYGWEVVYSVHEGYAWSYPDIVSGFDSGITNLTDIAVDPDGSPWIILKSSSGEPPYLYFTKWNGTGWDPVSPLFPDCPLERIPLGGLISIDSSGVAWVIWPAYVNDEYDSQLFFTRYIDSGWSSPQAVFPGSGPGRVSSDQITSSEDGKTWILWGRYGPDLYDKALLMTVWLDSAWAEPDTIPEGEYADGIAIDATGEPWVVTRFGSSSIWASHREMGIWSPLEQISNLPDGYQCDNGGIMRIVGDIPWVVWHRHYGWSDHGREIWCSARFNGSWLPEIPISSFDALEDERVEFDVKMNMEGWVVWQAWDGTDYEILYSTSNLIDVCVDEIPISSRLPIKCFPNPATERVNIVYSNSILIPEKVIIYDLSGRSIWRWDHHDELSIRSDKGGSITWDCCFLNGVRVPAGNYVIESQTNGGGYVGHIVVMN